MAKKKKENKFSQEKVEHDMHFTFVIAKMLLHVRNPVVVFSFWVFCNMTIKTIKQETCNRIKESREKTKP